MLIVVKIILVVFAVFGQARLFPERPAKVDASAENSLDSLVLPEQKPELALAQRALKAQGLCRGADKPDSGLPSGARVNPFAADTDSAVDQSDDSRQGLVTNCF